MSPPLSTCQCDFGRTIYAFKASLNGKWRAIKVPATWKEESREMTEECLTEKVRVQGWESAQRAVLIHR
jgi:hypothetical protein